MPTVDTGTEADRAMQVWLFMQATFDGPPQYGRHTLVVPSWWHP